MSASTIKIAGRTVVLGLEWRGLAALEPERVRAEVADLSKRLGARYAASVRTPSGHTMVGFVPASAAKTARRSVSGAVWLSAAVDRTTLVIQAAGRGRYWYALVRPGEIDPATDKICSETEIGQIADGLLGQLLEASHGEQEEGILPPRIVASGWEPEECPVSMLRDEIFEYESGGLAEVVAGTKPDKSCYVQQLTGIRPITIVIIVGVLVVVAAFAAYSVWSQRMKARAELEAARIAAAARHAEVERLRTLTDKRIQDAVLRGLAEDTATADPRALLASCVRAWQSVALVRGGWRLKTATCTDGSPAVAMTFERDAELLADNASLQSALQPLSAVPVLTAEGKEVVASFPVAAAPRREGYTRTVELPAYDHYLLRVGTWLQRYSRATGADVVATEPADRGLSYIDPNKEAEGPAKSRSPVPSDQSYRRGTVTVTGKGLYTLTALGPIGLPHVSIQTVTLQHSETGDTKWEAKGSYIVAN